MTVVTCRECGEPFERPDGGLHGVYLRILEKIRICPDCCEIAEAEAELEREEREQTERAERMRRREAACGIPELLRGLTWDRVASARPEAIDAARRWSSGELRGLFLAGPVGVGKTWLAAAAAWARLEHGPLRWFSAPVLLAHLSLGFENELHDRALLTLSDATTGALVLDDIDKTRPTEYGAEQLFCAIDNRATAGKPLLATSNLRLAELRDRYPNGYAIASRLGGYCDALLLEGHDRRLERSA